MGGGGTGWERWRRDELKARPGADPITWIADSLTWARTQAAVRS